MVWSTLSNKPRLHLHRAFDQNGGLGLTFIGSEARVGGVFHAQRLLDLVGDLLELGGDARQGNACQGVTVLVHQYGTYRGKMNRATVRRAPS